MDTTLQDLEAPVHILAQTYNPGRLYPVFGLSLDIWRAVEKDQWLRLILPLLQRRQRMRFSNNENEAEACLIRIHGARVGVGPKVDKTPIRWGIIRRQDFWREEVLEIDEGERTVGTRDEGVTRHGSQSL